MYSKPGCPYCQKARDYYNENNVEFIEYDAQNDKRENAKCWNFGRRFGRAMYCRKRRIHSIRWEIRCAAERLRLINRQFADK
jgi:hypothetical protein